MPASLLPRMFRCSDGVQFTYCLEILPARKDSTESSRDPWDALSRVATVFQDLWSPLTWLQSQLLLLKPSAPQHWPCPAVGSLLGPRCCSTHLCALAFGCRGRVRHPDGFRAELGLVGALHANGWQDLGDFQG